jgi:hypothetical protein
MKKNINSPFKRLEITEQIPLDTVLAENKNIVYDAILDSIEKSYKEKPSEIKVLELNIGGVSSSLTIEKKDYIPALKNALSYFERMDIEEYEKCSRCLNIVKYLNNK